MRVTRYDTAQAFLERAGGWLSAAEAENNLILGVCERLAARQEAGNGKPWLLTAEAGERVMGAAIQTPPFKLVLARAPEEAVLAICGFLRKAGAALPGVSGPPPEARAFARAWARRGGPKARPGRSQRVHQCAAVATLETPPGRFRPAEPGERELMLAWGRRFHAEAALTEPAEHLQKLLAERIAERRLFVWDDGGPACLAGTAGETPNGVRVGPVYTPPERRNRGYATACVAALTRQALEAGRRYCFLYTDLGNPVSNRVYARIGYRPVIDAQEWLFDNAIDGRVAEQRGA